MKYLVTSSVEFWGDWGGEEGYMCSKFSISGLSLQSVTIKQTKMPLLVWSYLCFF
jgi:hypothetical protein